MTMIHLGDRKLPAQDRADDAGRRRHGRHGFPIPAFLRDRSRGRPRREAGFFVVRLSTSSRSVQNWCQLKGEGNGCQSDIAVAAERRPAPGVGRMSDPARYRQ